jgi:hypothetical protein
MQVVVRKDGTETDITEGVQALYDLVISSMDFRSGFWSFEDAVPVAVLGRACGFEKIGEVERYLAEQQRSEAQRRFLAAHVRQMTNPAEKVEHEHLFDTQGIFLPGVRALPGRCLWPGCDAEPDGVSTEFREQAAGLMDRNDELLRRLAD